MDPYPTYRQLLARDDAPPGSSWGVFGEDAGLGTLNFIGPYQVKAAARLAREGRTFSLNWRLELPSPAFFGRHPPERGMLVSHDDRIVDDVLDRFYPQGSTHWDGLRHCAHPDHGFYDGTTLAALSAAGDGPLGIEQWARHGIVGRGLLLDVRRAFLAEGIDYDPLAFAPITAAALTRVAQRQGSPIAPGDVLLVRTGWLEAYEQLDVQQRADLAASGEPGSAGLSGEDLAEFLWDHRVAAVAVDNPAFEAAAPVIGIDLALHIDLIALLGMPIGELWYLELLAADCALDRRYETLLSSSPLNLRGAAGSPANAIAMK